MKKVIVTLAAFSAMYSYAQKKEVSAAYKAIDGGDIATANSQIAAAESILGNKIYLLDPETLEQYYYVKGASLIKAGKTADAAPFLAKIAEMGKSEIYTGKDADKNKVYFVGKNAADASGIQGLKAEKYQPTLSEKLISLVSPNFVKTRNEAVEAFNNKNYQVAAPKFEQAYYLGEAIGDNSKMLLYYAGIAYSTFENKDKAISIFSNLIDSGYTGVETSYTAKNIKTNEDEPLNKNTWEFYKKTGEASGYTDFKSSTTKSVENELYAENARLLLDSGKADEALALIDKGLKKFPNDSKLSEIQGLAYHKSGKTDQFIASLKSQLEKNPNDKVGWFNLGVMLAANPATSEEALAAYDKVIQLDPKYTNAYINASYLLMGDDGATIDKYNALRKAGKMDEANKVLEERRSRFARAIPYGEKWYSVEPNSIEAVSLLKGLYLSTKNEAKAAEFKAKEEAMKK